MNKKEFKAIVPMKNIEEVIYLIRGQKVILDRDLALLYQVETRILIQAVKRNIKRFPEDFMFQLTESEAKNLISQFVTSNSDCSRSQIVTLKRGQNIKYLPYAFTEQGVAMLSGVLRSPQAVEVNIEIMRTFIKLRHFLSSQKEVVEDLAEIKNYMLKRFNETDREFRRIWNAIEKLASPPERKEQQRIGFDLDQ